MSSVDSINSNNITFSGKTKVAKSKKAKGEKKVKTGALKNLITKPVKDSFHKAYGEDVKPTASLVADFTADKVLKLGMLTVGTVVLFSKMKSSTNGLTNAVKKAVKEHEGLGKKIGSVINDIKNNNADFVKATRNAMEDAANRTKNGEIAQTIEQAGGVKNFVKKAAKNIFKPKEAFNAEGKLGKLIKNVAGEKNAPKVMEKLRKVGISGGADLVDTAAAVGATAAVGSGLYSVTNEVTDADNAELAKKSRVQNIVNSINTVEKLANASKFVGA